MEELEALLERWVSKAKRFRDAHYHASARYRKLHYLLGMPSIVMSASLGTAVFATLEKNISLEARVGVGIITIAAAAFSAAHTFLRHAERAESHRQAYVGFESIVRSIEASLAFKMGPVDLQRAVEKIRKSLDDLNHAPELADGDRAYAHLTRGADASLPMLPASANFAPGTSAQESGSSVSSSS